MFGKVLNTSLLSATTSKYKTKTEGILYVHMMSRTLYKGVFRTVSNIYEGALCGMVFSRYLYSHNSPAQISDRILNTPLSSVRSKLLFFLLCYHSKISQKKREPGILRRTKNISRSFIKDETVESFSNQRHLPKIFRRTPTIRLHSLCS